MKSKTLREDRTAAEWKSVAKAPRCRRRILQAGFFFKKGSEMDLENAFLYKYSLEILRKKPLRFCRLTAQIAKALFLFRQIRYHFQLKAFPHICRNIPFS